MDSQWLTVIGLGLDTIGAVILAWGLFTTKKEAAILGAPYWGGVFRMRMCEPKNGLKRVMRR